MLSRRSFIKSSLFLGAASAATYSSLNDSSSEIIIERNNIKLNGKAKNFNNYRIAFITDIHVGPLLPEGMLERTLDYLKKEDLDLILLGGDYIGIPQAFRPLVRTKDSEITKYKALKIGALSKVIAAIPNRDGAYGVYGNHDHWYGRAEVEHFLNTEKCKLLKNQYIEIARGEEKLLIYGVDDFWTGIPEKKELPNANFKIMLCHNPDYLAQESNWVRNNFDYALCGHTHGGQIRLPLIGSLISPIRAKNLMLGLNQLESLPVYTSRGLGMVEIPYRINCPAELSIFTLTTA